MMNQYTLKIIEILKVKMTKWLINDKIVESSVSPY